MGFTRRRFLKKGFAAAAGIAGLRLLGKAASAQMRAKVGYMKIVDCASLFVAQEKGFFRKEGIELEVVPMVGGAAISPAVASGDLQVGWNNVISMYQAHVEGFDFKFITGGATNVKGTNDTHAIQVLRDSPVRTAKDLEGKTVATNTLNNIVHLMAMAWIDQNGGDSRKVKFVELPFPQMEAALAAKNVDAISAHEPFVTIPTGRGTTRVLAHNWGAVVPRFIIASWFASDRWIQRNRETCQAFIRAVSQGIDAINGDPAGARALMVKWTGLSPDLVQKVAMPVFEKNVKPGDLQVTIDLTYKYKLIGREFRAAEVISDLAPVA